MSKIAIDTVLLPPEEIVDLAIKLNRSLVGPETNKIVLGKSEGEAMPHMTLTMGCVEEDDLENMGQILDKITSEFKVGELNVNEIYVSLFSKWAGINTSNTEDLTNFHKTVSRELASFLVGQPKGRMFYSHKDSEEELPAWFFGFPTEKDFFPHITIGYGESLKIRKSVDFPIEFRPVKTAICHLGDYYTCRKILWSKDLK